MKRKAVVGEDEGKEQQVVKRTEAKGKEKAEPKVKRAKAESKAKGKEKAEFREEEKERKTKKKGNAKREREEGGEEAKGPQKKKKKRTPSRGPSGDAVSVRPELLDSETVTKKIEQLKTYIRNFPDHLKARMKDTTRQHRVDTQLDEIDACLDTANVKQNNFVLGLWGANGAGKSFLANFLCLSSAPGRGRGLLDTEVLRKEGPVRSSEGMDTISKIPVLLEYGPQIQVTCHKTIRPPHPNEETPEGAGAVVVDEPSVNTFESFEAAKEFIDSINSLEVSALTYTGPFLRRSRFKLCDLPGITTEREQHIVDNSQLFAAKNADGLFVFTKDRSFSAASVASLGLLLNKVLEERQLNRLPIVTVIYSHAYSEPNSWLQDLDNCEDKDRLITERQEQALASLRKAIEYVERHVDSFCPSLQGFLRARIFGELSRNCQSVLFYSPEHESQLRVRGVSYDTHAKLLEAIDHMKSRYIHSLLEPACHNKLKVENTYLHFLRDIKRCKNIEVKKQRAQAIIKFLEDHFQENANQLVAAWWEDENSPKETLLGHLASDKSRRQTFREAVLVLVPNLFEYATTRSRHFALRASFFMALLMTKPEILMLDQLIEEKEDEFRVLLEQLGHSVEADRPPLGGVCKIRHEELFKEIGQMVEAAASEIEKELEGGLISFTNAVKRDYPKVFPKGKEELAPDVIVEKVRDLFCKRLDAFNKQLGSRTIDKISELHNPWREFCGQPSEHPVVDDKIIKSQKQKLSSLSPRSSQVDVMGATEDTKLTLRKDGGRVLAETPRLFKHVFADVATASKQLRRNIESAKKRAFYLPEVRDRSNPGPFTLPHPFGVVGLLSSEEKAAFGYERVIRISFTNPEQPWPDMDSSPFTIKAYANWKSDLEQLLSSKGHWIYPIMIPTKGRYEDKQAHLVFAPSLPASTTNGGDCPHLVYAFVEEQELDKYVLSYDGASERLVFVSIPGKNRGVRFARSIIKLFQDHLRSSISRPFDYWWMIDDDVRQVRMYDTFGSATSMIPCDILLALLFAQKALTTAVDAVTPKLEVKSLLKDISSLFLDTGDLGIELATHKDDLYTAAGSPVSALEYLRKGEWSSSMKGANDGNEHHLQTFVQVLVEWRQTLLQNTNICQMAIANKKANEAIFRRHYNVEVSEGPGTAHYRVAIERCGTVLNYSPPLRLHSYTRWYELFVPQYEVDRRITAEKAGNGSVNFFLNEDKLLTKRLTKDNLSGFQLFKFDIEYGTQKNGGCMDFRRNPTAKEKRGEQPKTRNGKTAWIKHLGEDEIAKALVNRLYTKTPKYDPSERIPFVKWYIQCHDAAEEQTRQEKGQEHHFLQSAAEVFGVEIRFRKEKKGKDEGEEADNEDEAQDEDESEHEQVFNEQPTAPLIYITLLSP